MFQGLRMKMRGGLMRRDRARQMVPEFPGTLARFNRDKAAGMGSVELWFPIIKTDYFGLKRGTFFRVYGPEMAQFLWFGLFFENLSAETVATVPFFKKFPKKGQRTQRRRLSTNARRQTGPTSALKRIYFGSKL